MKLQLVFSVFPQYYRQRRENFEIAIPFLCFYTINYHRSRENVEIVTRFLMVLHYITAGGEKSLKLQLGF